MSWYLGCDCVHGHGSGLANWEMGPSELTKNRLFRNDYSIEPGYNFKKIALVKFSSANNSKTELRNWLKIEHKVAEGVHCNMCEFKEKLRSSC